MIETGIEFGDDLVRHQIRHRLEVLAIVVSLGGYALQKDRSLDGD